MNCRSHAVTSPSRLWIVWVLLFAVIFLFGFIRFRLADMPLERDEGEYAYAGQLILQGIPPYKLAYNMKLPGTYAAYAVLMQCFGQTARGIHIGLLVVNAATVVLLFLLGRRVFQSSSAMIGSVAALVAAASYAFLSASPSVLGLAAHANHFVVFFALAGLLMTLRVTETGTIAGYLLSGLLFGVAFLMKQHGLFFGVFALLWLLWAGVRAKSGSRKAVASRVALYGVGFLLPFAITCLILWNAGVFSKFWFWTISYAAAYASQEVRFITRNLLDGLAISVPPNEIFWVLGVAGVFLSFSGFKSRQQWLFLVGLLAFSLPAFAAGFYFRQHYFILLLPAVSLGIGAAVLTASHFAMRQFGRSKFVPAALAACLYIFGIFNHAGIFFQATTDEASRSINSGNPFIESVVVAEWIRDNSRPEATVAVVGSEPQIYFHALRRSSTGYIYTYPLMENHPYAAKMQKEMIEEIEVNKPDFIVFVGFPYSWLVRPESDKSIFNWFDEFSLQHYDRIGIVDYLSEDRAEYRWGAAALGQGARSNKYIYVFRRKES